MNKKSIIILTASLAMLAPVLSNAKEKVVSNDKQEPVFSISEQILAHPKPILENCAGVVLDDAQTLALKQAQFDFAKQKNTLDAAAKNAWMDYVHTLANSNSTKDQGLAASMAVKDAMMASSNANSDFEIKIFFDILKPEQREPALKCIVASKKQKMQDDLRRKCAHLPPTNPNP